MINDEGGSLSLIDELMIKEKKDVQLIENDYIDQIPQNLMKAFQIVDLDLINSVQGSSLIEYLDSNLTKRTHWFTRLTTEQIMVWDSRRISSPLLLLPHSLRFLAVQMFRHLLKYMDDTKKSKDSHYYLHQHIRLSIHSPEELKDEAYIQIIKQITNHPNADKELKGWNFFSVIASTYPPSGELYRCLIKYLFDILKDKNRDKVIIAKASYIAIRLYKTFSSKRQFPPSDNEISLIEQMKPIALSIYFYNGGFKTIEVESYFTMREIKNCFMKEHQMSLTKIPYYSIYEQCTKPSILEERYIDDDQNISDILSLWAIETKQSEKKGINISFRLCLKIHLYYSFNEDDIDTISMHYMQTCFEVIQGNYSLTDEEMCKLGVYQIIIEKGKKKINEVVNMLQTTIKKYIPVNHFRTFTQKEWIQKIMTVYTLLQDGNLSPNQAKVEYLNILKQNPLWQSTQLKSKYSNLTVLNDTGESKSNIDTIPDECVLGINPQGIIITNSDRKEVRRIPFKKIPSWAVNNDLVLVVVQDSDKQYSKYYFECYQTKLFQILMDSYTGILGGKDFSSIMLSNDQTGKRFASMPAAKLKEGQSYRSMQASSYVNMEELLIA